MIKSHLLEDDTFLPPPLSSYGISILNRKSPEKNLSGINLEQSEKMNVDNQSPSKLKESLSVHFQQVDSINNEHKPLNTYSNSSTHTNGLNQTTVSNSMLTQTNANNSQENLSFHSNSQSNLSLTSQGSEESRFTVKRLRGRRFGKKLGPPQRKSIHDILKDKFEKENEPEKINTDDQENLFMNLNLSKEKESELKRRIEEEKLKFKRPVEEPVQREALKDISKDNSNIDNRGEYSKSPIKQDKGQDRRAFDLIPQRQAPELNIQSDDRQRKSPGFNFPKPIKKDDFHIPLTPVNDFRRPKIPKISPGVSLSPEKPQQVKRQIEDSNDREKQQTWDKQREIEKIKKELALDTSSDDLKLPPAVIQSIKKRHHPHSDNKIIILNDKEYERMELLGRGGTSKVYKVKSLSNNRTYALKKVTFDQFDESNIRGFRGEIELLNKLKSLNRVVELIDYVINDSSIYLLMECGEIDLAHVLHQRLNTTDFTSIRFHTSELLKCVQSVHSAGIVHSDLKPANFIFVKGMLKIIDFGIADSVPDHTSNIYRDSQIGTPNYMSPEALIDNNSKMTGSNEKTWKVGKPSDIWSCGCIIYQMIYGKPPYNSFTGNQRFMAIINPQVKIQYPTTVNGVKVPKSAIELMMNCFRRDPNDRWTVDQCLKSEFLQPKIVNDNIIRDLVHSCVNYGYNRRSSIMGIDDYDQMIENILKQIDELNL
ncbi:serine/threonine-protein kinase Mps1p [[Candida] jaroonii]|uniref:Serine/threonine-protein kinase Mps1p n=1 Tax=[Candida] jaroonii TaxID=467808 RepID=A0ACA9Y4E4_9ASCO|nr:serine/threonine-protein kinase Mps1p [[Candida] jaroonii]